MPNTKTSTVKTLLAETMRNLLYKKSFRKISVNELCEIAAISRSSFYANFQDKYQLFSYCLNEGQGQLDFLMKSNSPRDFLEILLDFVQSESKFFYHAFSESYDEEITEILYHFFADKFTEILHEKVQEGEKISGPIEYVSAFYVGGLTSMILRWIKSNYSVSKEELAVCQYLLLKNLSA